MNLKIGIVGLPNAGKSTLFNALLKKQVAFAASYPFATIEPNIGVVPVPDERLEVISKLVNTSKIVPATVEFVDIAGLVKGASKGEGLGNKFLAHIREVNLICHVLRFFDDKTVTHVAGEIDPKRDLEIVDTELILADLETLGKQTKPRMNAFKEEIKRYEIINKLITGLGQGQKVDQMIKDPDEIILIRDLQLLTLKPVLYAFNVSESDLSAGKRLNLVNLPLKDEEMVMISAKIESELASLTIDEQKAYMKELGLEKSGLERLIQKAYQKLNLISYLTGGEKEARAWTVPNGTKAPQAAGVIHTDFEKHFIKAEVISYAEFVKFGGWGKAREEGKVRLEGKEYVMKDGDVVDFKIGN
ncbi:redox-regulated ATPase YchF [Candidatus Gottesmanbacteria bacterium RIFCSPHIGHO2_02_FULL_40_13]|uniref:Ribosome-binding ATPase YchF n=1 Tax=Candidatus Gottesmanbacteria bacterium RIFCSPHIGHO2_02_FULL_40_13 TaxID=1798384 RepID=A0A1F6A735_9BACT|nr:MAG: redox-regulated ATPase YchF [Candidatus Gottesmanbacteria bacterium RIFCSPHIGHO2_02_FULL_40_13]